MRLGLLDLIRTLLARQHGLQVPTRRFVAQVRDRLTGRHGADLDDGEAGRQGRVTLVGFGALGFAGEDVAAEVGFRGEGTGETDHLGGARRDGFGHGVSRLWDAGVRIRITIKSKGVGDSRGIHP